MRLQDPAHAQALAQLEQALVLVGGVEEDRLPGLPAPQDVHVVVHGPDHDPVDLRLRGLEVHLDRPV
jgi:hypothetical protein